MIYFIIRVLVTALALALTVILTPGISVMPLLPPVIDISGTYIIIGMIFGVINAVVRPLVLLFTARLLVRTMGLFALVLNFLLFWLFSALAPDALIIESPRLLWLLWASIFMALVTLVMEALFGLDKPEFRNQTEGQFYWRWVGMLSTGRRNAIAENLRVSQIIDIVLRYTKDIAVDSSPLSGFRVFMQELFFGSDSTVDNLSTPEKVRYMLEELGPTFVKFGQIMSSRTASLPAEWQEQLDLLQSNVPPFSTEKVNEIIVDELGSPPEELFAEFDPVPLAAASTAQVHLATLKDGTSVVVKVQRPNIDITVKADLNVMRDLTTRVQRGREWAQNIDMQGLVSEFADGILRELDYRNEANNARFLAGNMSMLPEIHVPIVYGPYSTSKVLTMEFIHGVKISSVDEIEAAGLDRSALAVAFVTAMMKQTLFDGFFHADPHPGNVLVNLETGQINFLDLGLMGELNREQRMALGDLLISMQQQDGYSLGKAVLHLTQPLPGREIDEKGFLEDMTRFGDRFLKTVGADLTLTISALQENARRNGLRLDSSFTLVVKTLMQAEAIVHTLDPSLSMTQIASQSVVELAREQYSADDLANIVRTQVTRSAREVIYRLPSLVEATTKWLDQYEKGQFTVHVDTSDLGKQVEKLNNGVSSVVNQLVMGLVLAGWIVGSAIATNIDSQIAGYKLGDFAFYMFVAGALVGGFVVLRGLWTSYRSKEKKYY
jgi:ubiquinone biosynthesis protein